MGFSLTGKYKRKYFFLSKSVLAWFWFSFAICSQITNSYSFCNDKTGRLEKSLSWTRGLVFLQSHMLLTHLWKKTQFCTPSPLVTETLYRISFDFSPLLAVSDFRAINIVLVMSRIPVDWKRNECRGL